MISTAAQTTALLTMLVSAMVTDQEGVRVTASSGPVGSVLFTVTVSPDDKGKVIGKQGRMARSLRIMLSSIAKEHGENYSLDVGGIAGLEAN